MSEQQANDSYLVSLLRAQSMSTQTRYRLSVAGLSSTPARGYCRFTAADLHLQMRHSGPE